MKKYLVLMLALSVGIGSSFAASFGDSLKNADKSDLNSVKSAVQQDVKNQQQEARKQKAAQNKAKIDSINKERKEKLAPVETEIKAKEAQIKSTKNDKTITETERTIRLNTYQRQLNSLNNKKANINKLYDVKVKAYN